MTTATGVERRYSELTEQNNNLTLNSQNRIAGILTEVEEEEGVYHCNIDRHSTKTDRHKTTVHNKKNTKRINAPMTNSTECQGIE